MSNNQTSLQIIEPRVHDLGGFSVRRVLPYQRRRAVGPFVFLDHMGPHEFPQGQSMTVRAHPHIGLATVTFLFEGAIVHRDNLGTIQEIHPGDINWMVAGSGISHSERSSHSRLHGLQIWVALPKEFEETAPSFHHHSKQSLPQFQIADSQIQLLVGTAFQKASPVKTYSDMFYFTVQTPSGKHFEFRPDVGHDIAVYVLSGEIQIEDRLVKAGTMAVYPLGTSGAYTVVSPGVATVVVLGGAPFLEPRVMWWNFVSSSQDKIERAKRAWAKGEISLPPEETDFIPLPEDHTLPSTPRD